MEDLVIDKSFKGTQYHVLIIRSVPQYYNMPCRFASPAEENKGIDGFVRDIPVQVKKRNGEPFHILMDINPPSHVMLAYRENRDASFSAVFDESAILDSSQYST